MGYGQDTKVYRHSEMLASFSCLLSKVDKKIIWSCILKLTFVKLQSIFAVLIFF